MGDFDYRQDVQDPVYILWVRLVRIVVCKFHVHTWWLPLDVQLPSSNDHPTIRSMSLLVLRPEILLFVANNLHSSHDLLHWYAGKYKSNALLKLFKYGAGINARTPLWLRALQMSYSFLFGEGTWRKASLIDADAI